MTAQFLKLDAALLARADVSPAAKLVFAVVADHLNAEGVAWLGIRRIARLTGTDGKLVQRALRRLEESNLIVIERRGSGRTNLYRLPTAEQNRGQNDHGQNPQAWSNCPPGVVKTTTEAWSNRPQTQRDLKNQTARTVGSKAETANDDNSQPVLIDVGVKPRRRTASRNGKDTSAPPPPEVAELAEHFANLRNARYRGTYHPKSTDAGDFAQMLSEAGDVPEAKVRIDRYFGSKDAYYREQRHPVVLLRRQFDRFATEIEPSGVDGHAAPGEHPLMADARERWAADVEAHDDEWRAIAKQADDGAVPYSAVRRSKAATGEEFRKSVTASARKAVAHG